MIEVEPAAAGCALRVDLPVAAVAYLDLEWLGGGEHRRSVPALIAAERQLRWRGGASVPLPQDLPQERAAALALIGIARSAVALLAGVSARNVEVIGAGAVAAAVRAGLGEERSGAGAPAAIVDTSGDPEHIRDALGRLTPRGVLVLAGEPLGRTLELDLYADLHRRGLEVVGVPPPLADPAPTRASAVDEQLADDLCDALVEVRPGASFRPAALWYRVA